jgi:hypothetical protein
MKRVKLALSSALIVVAGLASAGPSGEFSTYVYETKSGMTNVVVAFSGDGVTQEAQLDLTFDQGLSVVKAEPLVGGAVCVANPDVHGLRAVPPSGAGKALSTKGTDVCKFSLARAPSLAKSFKASSSISVRLSECASANGDVGACQSSVHDVSE